MKLEFADDRINEYAEGNTHFHKDAQPFEVAASLASHLLFNARIAIDGMYVNAFKAAESKPEVKLEAVKPAEKEEKKSKENK